MAESGRWVSNIKISILLRKGWFSNVRVPFNMLTVIGWKLPLKKLLRNNTTKIKQLLMLLKFLTISTSRAVQWRWHEGWKIFIKEFLQRMLINRNYSWYWIGKQSTKKIIKLIFSYFQIDEGRNLFEIPLIISSGKNTWRITKDRSPSKFQTLKKMAQG